jgi:hypothetical protein
MVRIETQPPALYIRNMSARVWGRIGWVAVVGLLAFDGTAGPLKNPRREVGAQIVDITPLLHWWTNHAGARPLTAWVHVTGNIVGSNSYGWIVDATVEASHRPGQDEAAAGGGGRKRIVLSHPPLQDRAAFDEMTAQLKSLEDQRTQANALETQANNYIHPGGGNAVRPHFAKNTWDLREAKAVQQQAAAQVRELDKQIKDLKARMAASWSNTQHYEVDCFALDTGQDQNRLPLYEHGAAWR